MMQGMTSDRKLPIYMLIDTSAAMSGPAIDSIHHALLELKQQLVRSPETLENGMVSFILFNDVAQLYAFAPLDELYAPDLVASGRRSFGAALHVLVESLQHDLDGMRVGVRSPQRPLVILIIGGTPTDAYEHDLGALLALPVARCPTFVVLACGDGTDTSFLRPLHAVTIPTQVVTPETLARAFDIVTRTIIHSSRGVPRDALVPPLNE